MAQFNLDTFLDRIRRAEQFGPEIASTFEQYCVEQHLIITNGPLRLVNALDKLFFTFMKPKKLVRKGYPKPLKL